MTRHSGDRTHAAPLSPSTKTHSGGTKPLENLAQAKSPAAKDTEASRSMSLNPWPMRMMFSGLTSPWTYPWSCMCDKQRATCEANVCSIR